MDITVKAALLKTHQSLFILSLELNDTELIINAES